MKVHHLNCGTIHTNLPFPGVTHCLLLEGLDSLALVDTGFGTADCFRPSRHVRWFARINGIRLDVEQTAVKQVERLGYDRRDVEHIVLTHLHLDHAGGIGDFPWAKVHVLQDEYDAARRPRTLSWIDQIGYAQEHLGFDTEWVLYSSAEERWFGLDCVTVLKSDPSVFLVPLRGHSRGHCGVAVERETGWLLHCGDAYVREMQIDANAPRDPFPFWVRPLSSRLFPREALSTLRVLRREHADSVTTICSHDPAAYAGLSEMPT